MANSWDCQSELRGAVGDCALLYQSPRWSGFVMESDMTPQQLEEATRRMKEPADEPDVFLRIIEEEYCVGGS